jgi:hypothetical protein
VVPRLVTWSCYICMSRGYYTSIERFQGINLLWTAMVGYVEDTRTVQATQVCSVVVHTKKSTISWNLAVHDTIGCFLRLQIVPKEYAMKLYFPRFFLLYLVYGNGKCSHPLFVILYSQRKRSFTRPSCCFTCHMYSQRRKMFRLPSLIFLTSWENDTSLFSCHTGSPWYSG